MADADKDAEFRRRWREINSDPTLSEKDKANQLQELQRLRFAPPSAAASPHAGLGTWWRHEQRDMVTERGCVRRRLPAPADSSPSRASVSAGRERRAGHPGRDVEVHHLPEHVRQAGHGATLRRRFSNLDSGTLSVRFYFRRAGAVPAQLLPGVLQ